MASADRFAAPEQYTPADPAERILTSRGALDGGAVCRPAGAIELLGEFAVCTNPPEVAEAEARFGEARALAAELGMRPLVAHCHLGVGTLYQEVGRAAEAGAKLAAAAALYRTMDMPVWLEGAEAALALCGAGSGREHRAGNARETHDERSRSRPPGGL